MGRFSTTCRVSDARSATAERSEQVKVSAGGGTPIGFSVLDVETGLPMVEPGGLLQVRSGQKLKFVATGTQQGTVSWSFGDGAMSSGNPAEYTYGPVVNDTTYLVALNNAQGEVRRFVAVKGSAATP
jgi:hypothetical protein